MKKCLFILLILFIFPTNIKAQSYTTHEYPNGVTYRFGENYSQKLNWANIYVNNVFAYCVEPQVLSNVNIQLSNSNNHDLLTNEQWERVTLIANYAEYYFAQTSNINFRYAGQILIHEYVDKTLGDRAVFINGVQLNTANEESLILQHVDDYAKVIDTSSINVNLLDDEVLENDLLKEYEVVSYDKKLLDVKIEDGKLVVNGKNEGVSKLVLKDKSKYITKGAFYWYGDSTQDLITSTAALDYKIAIDVKVEDDRGKLIVNKFDESTKESLSGAGFLLYQFDKRIDDYVKYSEEVFYTNETGKFELDIFNEKKVLPKSGKINYSFMFISLALIFKVFRGFNS